MNKTVANVISKSIFSIAKSSSNTACYWSFFQPKVPAKLLKDK